MPRPCIHCDHQLQCEDTASCVTCLDQVDTDLQDIPLYYWTLTEKPHRGTVTGGPTRSQAGPGEPALAIPEKPMPLAAGNIALRDKARIVINEWRTADNRDDQQIVRRIHLVADQMRTAVDPVSDGVPIGIHRIQDEHGDSADCGKVWTTGDGWATCRHCRMPAELSWWEQQWPTRAEDPLILDDAAAMLAVEYNRTISTKLLRKWIEKGSVEAVRHRGRVAITRGQLRARAEHLWGPKQALILTTK